MIKYLIEKEFKQLFRNPFIPKLMVVMPLLVMLVFPFATTMEIKSVNLSIIDNDHSVTSRKLIEKISSTSYFDITDVSFNHEEAMKSIEYGVADIIVEIPNNFENEIMRESTSTILLLANSINPTKANMGSSYLTGIINDFANDLSLEDNALILSSLGGITIDPYYKFNPTMDYKIPMIPALMVLLITILCGFIPSMNIVGEKEAGTIEQINVTPIPKTSFIAAKLIPYWIMGIVIFSISMAVALLVFRLSPVGNVFALYLVTIIYILAVSGLGLIISNYSDNLQQAMFLIFFFIIIMLLISGLFTPISSMPYWAQGIARMSPLTYYTEAMRSIYLKGSTLKNVSTQLYALVGFFVVFTTWAILSYKKRD